VYVTPLLSPTIVMGLLLLVALLTTLTPTLHEATYDVITAPPLLTGATKRITALLLAALAATFNGAEGTLRLTLQLTPPKPLTQAQVKPPALVVLLQVAPFMHGCVSQPLT
jgi:hypothetical protein